MSVMSVTTALLGFRPAPTAGRARSAGLRGAGCLVPPRTTRLRRVATAKAPPPPPFEAPPSHADTPPSSWEPQHQQQAEKNWLGHVPGLIIKIIAIAACLVNASRAAKGGNDFMAAVDLFGAVVMLVLL